MANSFEFKISIFFFQAVEENGIWSLVIRRVGHSDAGNYECQTNSEIKGSVTVNLDIKGILKTISVPFSNLDFSEEVDWKNCKHSAKIS